MPKQSLISYFKNLIKENTGPAVLVSVIIALAGFIGTGAIAQINDKMSAIAETDSARDADQDKSIEKIENKKVDNAMLLLHLENLKKQNEDAEKKFQAIEKERKESQEKMQTTLHQLDLSLIELRSNLAIGNSNQTATAEILKGLVTKVDKMNKESVK